MLLSENQLFGSSARSDFQAISVELNFVIIAVFLAKLANMSCSIMAYLKVTSSRPVYYSIFDHFLGATNWDVLLTEGYYTKPKNWGPTSLQLGLLVVKSPCYAINAPFFLFCYFVDLCSINDYSFISLPTIMVALFMVLTLCLTVHYSSGSETKGLAQNNLQEDSK